MWAWERVWETETNQDEQGGQVSFKDKAFKDRFSDVMWNHSERYFEDRWPHPFRRCGLGPEDDDFPTWKLSSFVRHQPDYMTNVNDTLYYVEVQGTGKNGSHKFKQSKLDACRRWNKEHQVWFWLWDDEAKQEHVVSLQRVQLLIAQGAATKGMFDGKRPYFELSKALVAEQGHWRHRVR